MSSSSPQGNLPNGFRSKDKESLVKENNILRQERDTAREELDQQLRANEALQDEHENLQERLKQQTQLAESLSQQIKRLRHQKDEEREAKWKEREEMKTFRQLLDGERRESGRVREELKGLSARHSVLYDEINREREEKILERKKFDDLLIKYEKLLQQLQDQDLQGGAEDIFEDSPHQNQNNRKKHPREGENERDTQSQKRMRETEEGQSESVQHHEEESQQYSNADSLEQRNGQGEETISREHQPTKIMPQHEESSSQEQEEKAEAVSGISSPLPGMKEIIYYSPDKKHRVAMHPSDLDLLEKGKYLNDNLVQFGIYKLQEKYSDQSEQVYFFSTHFYTALTRGAAGINYDSVRTWTRNKDIFTYEFALVPIHESNHWYLALIFKLEKTGFGIVTLDSMGTSRRHVIKNLGDYLVQEAQTRQLNLSTQIKDFGLQPGLQSPRQENASDCAFYLLGFMEKFLSDPARFRDTIISVSSIRLSWWDMDPPRISRKRKIMLQSLREVFALQADKDSSPGFSAAAPSINLTENQRSDGQKPISWKDGIALAILHKGPKSAISIESIRNWMEENIADKTTKNYESSSFTVTLSSHGKNLWRNKPEGSVFYELIYNTENEKYFEDLCHRFEERKAYLRDYGMEERGSQRYERLSRHGSQ